MQGNAPDMFRIVGYALLFAVLGVVWFYLIRSVARMARQSASVKRQANEIMGERQPLSPVQFGSEFFPKEQVDVASRLLDILRKVLIVDVSRIHPDDRLVEDLGLGQVDGLDPNWLACDIKDSFGVSLEPGWASIKTVRDLVTYVSTHCPTA